MKDTTVNELAQLLFEEFGRDYWGDIDPDLLEMVAQGIDISGPAFDDDGDAIIEDFDEDTLKNVAGLREVLTRVLSRLQGDKQ